MKRLASLTLLASLLASAVAYAQVAPVPGEDGGALRITRVGSQPSTRGAADYFTGAVRIDPLFPAQPPSRTSGGSVTFEPGARSAWHTHPLGQALIVTAGVGWVQQWG